MSVERALKAYFARQLTTGKRGRKNKAPEAELKAEVLSWLKANGFSAHSIESKAVYSARAGRYLRGQTSAGVADIFGAGPNGIAVFIELKAPGRLSTLKPHQRAFLRDKIDAGAFAVCVDAVASLSQCWTNFMAKREVDIAAGKSYLEECLPREKRETDSGLGL